MLTAVAGRRAGLDISGQDIIVSVAGGMRISEPAADLAIVLAIASSLHNRPLASDMAVFGEIGLGGEVRTVPQVQRRLQEAQRLGLTRAVLSDTALDKDARPPDMNLVFARTVSQAIKAGLGERLERREAVVND